MAQMNEKWPRLAFWRNYPLSRATAYMKERGFVLRAHVLVLGKFGFAVIWKKKHVPSVYDTLLEMGFNKKDLDYSIAEAKRKDDAAEVKHAR